MIWLRSCVELNAGRQCYITDRFSHELLVFYQYCLEQTSLSCILTIFVIISRHLIEIHQFLLIFTDNLSLESVLGDVREVALKVTQRKNDNRWCCVYFTKSTLGGLRVSTG